MEKNNSMRFICIFLLTSLVLFSCSGSKEEPVNNSVGDIIDAFFDPFDEFSTTPYLSKLDLLIALNDEDRSICTIFDTGALCIVRADTLHNKLFTNKINDKVFEFKAYRDNSKIRVKYEDFNHFQHDYILFRVERKQEGLLGSCLIHATELYSFSDADIIICPECVNLNIAHFSNHYHRDGK
jgi:hypothetical protein